MGEQQEQDTKKLSRWVIAAIIAVPVGVLVWPWLFDLFPFNLIYGVLENKYLLAGMLMPCVLAIVGLIDSCRVQRKRWGITLAGAVIVAMMLIAPTSQSRICTIHDGCISNQRQLAVALMMELQEHGEVLPADTQLQALQVQESTLRCRAKKQAVVGYGLNAHMRGRALEDLTDPTTLILTADGGDAKHLLKSSADIDRSRHGKKGCIASHVDGHIEAYTTEEQMRLK